MKIAPLAFAISMLAANAAAQPFAMVGAETLYRRTVGYDWPQEHGDAASEVAFSCELEVSVGPESSRRATFGVDKPASKRASASCTCDPRRSIPACVGDETIWNVVTIEKRQKRLASLALKAWPLVAASRS